MTSRREQEAGLTLIEVLVVLAIVGVMTGVTVLGMGALDRGSSGAAEAMRMADRLRLAVDEVMVTSIPLAMVWDDRGYQFFAWETATTSWQQSGQRDLGKQHSLPTALRLEREGSDDGAAILITPDLSQPPVVLRIAGTAGAWSVAFDGFGASVTMTGN